MACRKPRSAFTPEQDAVLKEAFNGGLKSVAKKNDTEIQQLAERLNLTVDQVKAKIGNLKVVRSQVRNSSAVLKRLPSGYSQFLKGKGAVPGSEQSLALTSQWNTMSEEEKLPYMVTAKGRCRIDTQDMSTKQKAFQIKKCINIINAQCQIIKELDGQAGGMVMTEKDMFVFGSHEGQVACSSTPVQAAFLHAMSSSIDKDHRDVITMRNILRDSFNVKARAVGLSRFPYKAVRAGVWGVTGWPANVSCKPGKNLSEIGLQDLMNLHSVLTDIKLTPVEPVRAKKKSSQPTIVQPLSTIPVSKSSSASNSDGNSAIHPTVVQPLSIIPVPQPSASTSDSHSAIHPTVIPQSSDIPVPQSTNDCHLAMDIGS